MGRAVRPLATGVLHFTIASPRLLSLLWHSQECYPPRVPLVLLKVRSMLKLPSKPLVPSWDNRATSWSLVRTVELQRHRFGVGMPLVTISVMLVVGLTKSYCVEQASDIQLGLYHRLHGVARPVEMKKSFIKRRKRVMPASGQETRPRQDQTSSVSVSPDLRPSALPLHSQGSAYDHSHHNLSGANIDPMLDPRRAEQLPQERSHYPPPIDFTSYTPQRAQIVPAMAQYEHHYDPVHDHNEHYEHAQSQAPGAKRRRSPSPSRNGDSRTASTNAIIGFVAANSVNTHNLIQPPTDYARQEAYNTNTGEFVADASVAGRSSKKEKAKYLAEQIRRMQLQLDELGGEGSGEEDDRGEG